MIDMELALNIFSDMIKDLIDNYNFESYIRSPRQKINFYTWVEKEFSRDDSSAYWTSNGSCDGSNCTTSKYFIANGCCRFILGNNNYPFVFKADFGNRDKFCAKEAKNYEAAVEECVDEYFAEMHYLTTFENIAFYVMERVEANYEDICDEMCNTLIDIAVSKGEYADEDEAYEEIECTGSGERVDEFFEEVLPQDEYHNWQVFCEDHNITDIHAGNIGKIGDRWVVIDYAGYY